MSDESVTPSEPTGILGMLAQRRKEIADAQVLTLEVPRWTSPKLIIRFRPIDHQTMRKGAGYQERNEKDTDPNKRAQAELDANADLLINSCIEIKAILPDGSEIGLGPDGRSTRFDADTAVSLGMPDGVSARAVCKELFITGADLLLMSRALGEWSGYRVGAVDEALVGES